MDFNGEKRSVTEGALMATGGMDAKIVPARIASNNNEYPNLFLNIESTS
ncbi:MAG: hypothetical protein ACM3QX_07125 [Syntrophomonadaceae bacterium]